MSLNDEVINDDNSLDIVMPDTTTNKKEQIEIIAINKASLNTETELSESDIAAISNMDVKFKLITDGAEKIVEMKDVEAEILSTESMSKNTAKYIDSFFAGLISENNFSIEEFTNSPSKTNYATTCRYIKKRISLEKIDIISSFKLFREEPISDTIEVLIKCKDFYIPKLIEKILELNKEYSNLNTIINEKDVIFIIDQNTVNILNTDLKELKLNDSFSYSGNVDILNKAITNLNNVFSDINFKELYLTMILNNSSLSDIKFNEIKHIDKNITMRDIIKFTSIDIELLLTKIISEIELTINELNKIKDIDTESIIDNDSDDLYKTLIDGNNSLSSIIKATKQTVGFINALSAYTANSQYILTFISNAMTK